MARRRSRTKRQGLWLALQANNIHRLGSWEGAHADNSQRHGSGKTAACGQWPEAWFRENGSMRTIVREMVQGMDSKQT